MNHLFTATLHFTYTSLLYWYFAFYLTSEWISRRETSKWSMRGTRKPLQDYEARMQAHRDNVRWVQYSLEATSALLRRQFVHSHLLCVRPSHMNLGTFAVYKHFVLNCNDFGTPAFDKASMVRFLGEAFLSNYSSGMVATACTAAVSACTSARGDVRWRY